MNEYSLPTLGNQLVVYISWGEQKRIVSFTRVERTVVREGRRGMGVTMMRMGRR